MNFRVAAKAFIVKDGKLLMMKRRANDPHKPGALDIPGGRLELGENPYDGLKREVKEEISSEVEIRQPLSVVHFTRDDGQTVTLIMFLCKLLNENIALSDEHEEVKWVNLDTESDLIPKFFANAVENFQRQAKN